MIPEASTAFLNRKALCRQLAHPQYAALLRRPLPTGRGKREKLGVQRPKAPLHTQFLICSPPLLGAGPGVGSNQGQPLESLMRQRQKIVHDVRADGVGPYQAIAHRYLRRLCGRR